MNTNVNAIKILCYGDSNTWGRDPHGSGIRYPVNVRWTGLLQAKLGNDYWIVEEGLGGRTTVLDDPKKEGRNGKIYLKPCLETHYPIDVVVLMLGTNDFKERLHQSAQDIGNNIEQLVHIINDVSKDKNGNPSKIILLSPPYFDESIQGTQQMYKGAEEKSKQLAQLYQKVAEKYNCKFIDIAQYVEPSKIDGYHLDPAAHAKIAEVLVNKIQSISIK